MPDGYIQGILALSTLMSVALGFAHKRLRSITAFASGMLLICAIMLPLVDIFRDFDIDDALEDILPDVDIDEMTDDKIELAFEEGVAEYICEEYSLEKDSVLVNADGFDLGTLRAEKIYITLYGKAVLTDYKRIEAQIEERFTRGGECEVSIHIG